MEIKKGHLVCVKASRYSMWRPVTPAETKAWYDSDESKGMTDDGETKLPPRESYSNSDGTKFYRVVRSRVAARRGYHTVSGCCQVEDADGNLLFVERKNLC